MAGANGVTNGTNGPNGINGTSGTSGTTKFNPDFTRHVIENIGPNTLDRARFVMSSLIKHLHDFINTSKRNEGQRICDVLGIESLVDEVANKIILDSDENPTSSTILGPFWSPHAPFRELGDSIVQDPYPGGQVTYMHGVVTDVKTGKPIPNSVVDIWQASANGQYDFQDDNQSVNNLRGKFRTNDKGEYYYSCYYPTAYSLPTDGPAGKLLKLLDRHPMRPAHIHLMVSADGYKSVTTQLFPPDDPYASTDTFFAVKDDLLLDFKPSTDPKTKLDLEYNITLAKLKPGAPKPWLHTVF